MPSRLTKRTRGAATSTTRTADQTQIALFWLDDVAYIWNLVARGLAEQRHSTLPDDVLRQPDTQMGCRMDS